MSYIFTKKVNHRFIYYLGKNGKWEGLKDNAVKHYDYSQLSYKLLKLRIGEPKGTIDFIDLEK